jgi:AcrR family transcriptional regulator
MEPRLHILHRVRVVSDAPNEPVVPPLRRDAERNRRLILEHARQVVAVSGLGASHEQIAHAAGVGIGTVYRRFPRKSDLFVALFDDQLDRVVQLARAALEVPDPWTALTGFLEAILDQIAGSKSSYSAARGPWNCPAGLRIRSPLSWPNC